MNRRGVVAGLIAAGAAAPAFGQARPDLRLTGRLTQGGCVVGRTRPGALIFVDGEALTAAGASGRFFIGFDRDCGTSSVIEARQGAWRASETISIAPGNFPSQSISGLPPSTVDPTDPALLARIQSEAALKADAYASRTPTEDFSDGFDWPLATF